MHSQESHLQSKSTAISASYDEDLFGEMRKMAIATQGTSIEAYLSSI